MFEINRKYTVKVGYFWSRKEKAEKRKRKKEEREKRRRKKGRKKEGKREEFMTRSSEIFKNSLKP